MTEGKRLEKEIELEATVDEVWETVSTGPGFSAWFVPHHFENDERGRPMMAESDFGSGNTQEGRLLEWEPDRHRVVYGSADPAQTEALEFIVEGRDNGSTLLRLVQSGVQGEDWEMEYHAHGWDVFFLNLRSYLRYFRGRPVANALAMNFTAKDAKTVWDRYHSALGTDRGLAVGDQVDLAPAGVEPIKGTVDLYHLEGVLGIRTDDGLYRFGGAGSGAWGMVNSFHYRYGTDVDSGEWTAKWQAWLDGIFPASEAPPAPAA